MIESAETSAKTAVDEAITPSQLAVARTSSLSTITILLLGNLLVFFNTWYYQGYVLGTQKFLDTYVFSWFDSDLLIKCGALYGPYTLGGEYWRLFTSFFLHVNAWHLAGNMLVLFRIGRLFKGLLDGSWLLAIYVFSGVGGSLMSLYWHRELVGVGSSAAVLGLAGALISLMALGRLNLPRQQKISNFSWLVLLSLLVLLLGQFSKNTDNAGHLGGLFTGLCLGVVIARMLPLTSVQSNAELWRLLAGSSAIMVVLFGVLLLVQSRTMEYNRGKLALKNNKNDLAVMHFQKYLGKNPNDLLGHFELGVAYNRLARNRESAEEYRRALEIDPNDAQAQYNLACIQLFDLNRVDQSIPLFRASVARLPLDSDRSYNFSLALMMVGETKEAEQYARMAVSLDPKSSRNHSILSSILASLGKEAEARKESDLAQQLESTH